MPEGDTVWLAAQRMHEALAGRVLTRTDFRVPQLATADLRGRTVTEVVARGKHLLIRIGPDPSTGARAVTLHSHLMMEGRWEIEDLDPLAAGSDSPGRRRPGASSARSQRRARPKHTIRAVLETAGAESVRHAQAGDDELRGAGVAALKSAPLWSVSWQPFWARCAAVVLERAGAAVAPSKKLALP